MTILEELNAKSVIVNAHPKVNAYKLWAFTLSVDLCSPIDGGGGLWYDIDVFQGVALRVILGEQALFCGDIPRLAMTSSLHRE